MDKEATMWAQRFCLLWVRLGDRNTKYVHSWATKRYWRNSIVGNRNEQDTWQVQPKEIASIMTNYYKELFSSSRLADSTNVLACVPNVIIDEMNASLCCGFDES